MVRRKEALVVKKKNRMVCLSRHRDVVNSFSSPVFSSTPLLFFLSFLVCSSTHTSLFSSFLFYQKRISGGVPTPCVGWWEEESGVVKCGGKERMCG